MTIIKRIVITFSLGLGIALIVRYFLSPYTDNPAVFLKETLLSVVTSNVENARFKMLYVLTKKKYTLTVLVDQPDVTMIQVYSGPFDKIAGNPSGNIVFPEAELIDEKNLDTSGRTTFELKPGRYFIYPWINTQLHGFGGRPEEVYLDHDMVVQPSYSFDY